MVPLLLAVTSVKKSCNLIAFLLLLLLFNKLIRSHRNKLNTHQTQIHQFTPLKLILLPWYSRIPIYPLPRSHTTSPSNTQYSSRNPSYLLFFNIPSTQLSCPPPCSLLFSKLRLQARVNRNNDGHDGHKRWALRE